MANELDELLTQLGTGWWNVIHYIVLTFCISLPTYHALGGAFLAPNLDYTCITNESSPFINTQSPQNYHNISVMDECNYIVHNHETGDVSVEACEKWSFENTTFTTTITSEFQLTCDRAYLQATYQSMYMIGMFVGALLSGFTADRYGRKTTMIFGITLYITITNTSCLATNFTALLFFRFLLGFSSPLMFNTVYILVVEITEPRLRPQLGILCMLPWAFNMMIWGSVAYLIREWRWLQFTVSIPGVLVLPFLWYIDESPRWLSISGKQKEAIRVLTRAARLNRTQLPPGHELVTIFNSNKEKESSKHSPEHKRLNTKLHDALKSSVILFRTPKLRNTTICLYVVYLLVNMVYFGLSLSGGNLSENPYVFMILSGLMEVPAYTLTIPIVARFGRKWPTLISFSLAGISLLAIAPTPIDFGWVIMLLAMFGKLAITSAYQILIFYSTELFPTEVRSRGIGTSLMVSRIGSIVSPFINEVLGSAYSWAPAAVFGASSMLASVIVLLLPETLGDALPDTVEHFEATGKKKWKRKSWLPVSTSEEVSSTK